MFADDLKIFKQISSKNDCNELQEDINSIADWCNKNRLKFNINKCKVVTFRKITNWHNFNYCILGEHLSRTDKIRDLGVVFMEKLNFNEHIINMVNSAYKTLGFVLRNSRNFNNINTFLVLFNSFVRSKLEYGSNVWSPNAFCHNNHIEKVQKKFVRYLYFKLFGLSPFRISYLDQIQYIKTCRNKKILTLSLRRDIASLCFVHKIIHNSINSPEILQEINFKVPNIKFRNKQYELFSTKIPNSPLDKMLLLSNKKMSEYNIDLLQINFSNLRYIIKSVN